MLTHVAFSYSFHGGTAVEGFTMEIAGAVIRVQPLFQSTKEYCRPYLTERLPDYCVEVFSEDLPAEQARLEQEAVEEGLKIRKFKEPFLERSIIQQRVADYLLTRDVLMMHGSTIAVDGNAYLFTAPCGTGKSTHTRLWRDLFGQRAIMVNDDKPFLQITSEGVFAYGSPWSGKHGLATNVRVPLKGICSLHRGSENQIYPARIESVIELLYHQAHLPESSVLAHKARALTDTIARMVPLWEMDCTRDPEAAKIAYSAMSGSSDI
jgi:hypothetical protein